MKSFKKILLVSLAVIFVVTSMNCATIINGVGYGEWSKPPEKRQADVNWGWVVCDYVLTGGLGMIVDLATGMVYKDK